MPEALTKEADCNHVVIPAKAGTHFDLAVGVWRWHDVKARWMTGFSVEKHLQLSLE
jgi:hypothetical protein